MSKEEERWLKNVQKKFTKYINSDIWDCIELSDLQYSILHHIMNAETVKELSPTINEKTVDFLLDAIDKKYKECKKKIINQKDYEK